MCNIAGYIPCDRAGFNDTVLRSFDVVTPDLETFEDHEGFLFVGIVVALSIGEGT